MTHLIVRRFSITILALFLIACGTFYLSDSAFAGEFRQERDKPPYDAYKGVSIGMSMDEARGKLGSPRDKSDTQDMYVFSGDESAQIYYDTTSKTVLAITVTFSGKLDNVPNPKGVFGDDAEVKPDGGIFKMVRYPKAGYWISYNKIVGDDPIIIIAMKKI